MEFVKVQALSNDFILIPDDVTPDPEDIRRWCERRTGVGADGVLTAVPLDSGHIRMRYWNADGGEAEMCGNGLRCVALYAVETGWVPGHDVVIETAVGSHAATVDGENVRAYVGSPHRFRTETLNVAGFDVHPVGIGNPHAILFVESVDEAAVDEVGPQIENDPIFPGRTNVEFVEVSGEDQIRVRVWERGVGETLASGTGASAAAFAAYERNLVSDTVAVELRGGTLMIELDDKAAWMKGPAQLVFRGRL